MLPVPQDAAGGTDIGWERSEFDQLARLFTDFAYRYTKIRFFIFVVTPCMLSSYSIVIPTTAHI